MTEIAEVRAARIVEAHQFLPDSTCSCGWGEPAVETSEWADHVGRALTDAGLLADSELMADAERIAQRDYVQAVRATAGRDRMRAERDQLKARIDAALVEIRQWWGTAQRGDRVLMAVNSILQGKLDAASLQASPQAASDQASGEARDQMTPQEQLSAYENGYQEDLGVGRYACAPKAFDALRAVLDRHQPVDRDTGPHCAGCGVPCPCSTVKAITTALGETS